MSRATGYVILLAETEGIALLEKAKSGAAKNLKFGEENKQHKTGRWSKKSSSCRYKTIKLAAPAVQAAPATSGASPLFWL